MPIDAADLKKVHTTDRLRRLRALMLDPRYNLTAYVIPSEDAHQSEYIADCDKRRHYISGFSGSAGCAVVTRDTAALFTDGRYFLQASQELDENWTLMKQGLPGVPTWQDYLLQVASTDSRIGMDPTLITAPDARALRTSLSSIGAEFVTITENLIDNIWDDRPERPTSPAFVLPIKYTGQSMADKIKQLRAELKKDYVSGIVLSALDEIAWLFNLRGSDIDFNPVFFAYSLVTNEEVFLYIDEKKITPQVREHLGDTVQIKPYNSIFSHLRALGKINAAENKQKLLLTTRASIALEEALGTNNIVEGRSPIMMSKAIKNPVELEGMRQSHLRDAAALCNYFAWLEGELVAGQQEYNEVQVADKLAAFRAEQADFVGLSFDTISGSGANGAIIHYKPEPETCAIVKREAMYLCDSGGQYRDGTTDVTRTWHFGTPTDYEKRCFTRVLQGHIAIDTAVFPSTTTGFSLDILARAPLWKDGLDYRHGTGHGVGSFLNVHEGPQGIGYRPYCHEVPLMEGMTVTNEPGYYEDGKFGIRIENVLLVRKVDTPQRFGDVDYLGFENVTMVPIHKKLIDISLLTPEERQWVDNHHKQCFERVSPLLDPNGQGYAWLKRETSPL
ncbi:Creatinase/aminopeptidase [Syncephalis plumigaleata]|nr:Creatinase/aminopeptidase [Syncephalis plumigaleata]